MISFYQNTFFIKSCSISLIAGLMSWIVLFSLAEYCFCKKENPVVEFTFIQEKYVNNHCLENSHFENFSIEQKIANKKCSNLPFIQPLMIEQKINERDFALLNLDSSIYYSFVSNDRFGFFNLKNFQNPNRWIDQIKKVQLLI
jgi:hypothetical protein